MHQTPWKPRPAVQDPEFPGLTGKQLCQLMRKHKVTIRELSRRMGITQKRIRVRRETGVAFPWSLDWQQAIRDGAVSTELTPRERACLNQWRMNRRRISSFRALKASPAIDVNATGHEAIHWTDESSVLYGTHSEGKPVVFRN